MDGLLPIENTQKIMLMMKNFAQENKLGIWKEHLLNQNYGENINK